MRGARAIALGALGGLVLAIAGLAGALVAVERVVARHGLGYGGLAAACPAQVRRGSCTRVAGRAEQVRRP